MRMVKHDEALEELAHCAAPSVDIMRVAQVMVAALHVERVWRGRRRQSYVLRAS